MKPTGARRCSRTACSQTAVATLTYVYADSTAVVGPLAVQAEPHCYDLCEQHAQRLTAPRGWAVVRHEPDHAAQLVRSSDDLEALANAVREAARSTSPVNRLDPATGPATDPRGPAPGRRGHLRAVPTPL